MTRYSSALHAALYQAAMRYIKNEKDAHALAYECSDILHIHIREPSMRDQIAMAALTGLLVKVTADDDKDAYASCAYDYADAMLGAREPKL